MSFKFEIGSTVEDKVTRFRGVIIGRAEYITELQYVRGAARI